jgi:DNA-binding response OmpR family regulator
MEPFSKTKIVVCDSNPLVYKAIAAALGPAMYEFTYAKDGRQGLEFLKGGSYDMMITEILLPFFSGLELVHFIRSAMHSAMPVLMLSIIKTRNTIDLAYQLGASDFIEKPFAPGDLRNRIDRILISEGFVDSKADEMLESKLISI